MSSGETENVRLSQLLGTPGLEREFELLRMVEVRNFVSQHPERVRDETGLGIRIHRVELASLGLHEEVTSEGRQEHGVRPARFRVQQAERLNIIGGVHAAANEQLGLLQIFSAA